MCVGEWGESELQGSLVGYLYGLNDWWGMGGN